MPRLKDLCVSAHVIVDGKPVEEYTTEVIEGKKATCYIPSQVGQVFPSSLNCTDYITEHS